MVDLLREDTAHDGAAVLEGDRRVVGDRGEQRPLVVRERRVAIADELADQTPLPPERHPDRVSARAPFRPGDLPALEDERRARRVERLHRRLDDRLERLLEVERFRHRLRDARQRLELRDPPLRVRVELRVLDRLGNLARDRRQEVDLRARELPLTERAHVERAGQLLAREDRHGEDRLVLVLRQVRERLEARVEVRLLREHDGRPLGRGDAGDPFPGPHPRPSRHLVDPRAVRRPQDELAGALVVEVDEAGVGAERVRDLARDEAEHLLEVERRVHGGDRLRQEAEVPRGGIHGPIVGGQRNSPGSGSV